MCMTVTSYYLVCGHAHHQSISCAKAARFEANIGTTTDYCTSSRSYTSLVASTCEVCTFLHGLEDLRFNNDPDEPLIWMNNIYRASVHGEEPQPYDRAIDDSMELVVAADMRGKRVLRRSARICEGAALDGRRFIREKKVACRTPWDIFYNEREARVGAGTPPRGQAQSGRFGARFVDGIVKRLAMEEH